MTNEYFRKLTEYFVKFPGIGPRQAGRFVYFSLHQGEQELNDFASLVSGLKRHVKKCEQCARYFEPRREQSLQTTCFVCADPARDNGTLMIVEKDVDIDALERAGVYQGKYFVLGKLIPVLAENPEERVSGRALEKRITASGLKEIVIALAASPDGDNTTMHLQKILRPLAKRGLTITVFGRGLSTGIELEYSDTDTIRNAFQNRA